METFQEFVLSGISKSLKSNPGLTVHPHNANSFLFSISDANQVPAGTTY